MRRLILMVVLLLLIPLTALAQVEGDESTGEAISITATVLFVSGGIAYVIEWVRGRFPNLDGDILRVVSLVMGLGAVYAWDLRVAADYGYAGLPDLLDAVASALVIAFGAGVIGTWKNAKRAEDPTSSIHEQPAPPLT